MSDGLHALPVLTPVSGIVVLASFVGAGALHLLRRANGMTTGRGQFFNDGGAMISLIILVCMAWNMFFPADQVEELVRENGILVAWAIGYAALMVALNLLDSARRGAG